MKILRVRPSARAGVVLRADGKPDKGGALGRCNEQGLV
jgi:hypothetical protein